MSPMYSMSKRNAFAISVPTNSPTSGPGIALIGVTLGQIRIAAKVAPDTSTVRGSSWSTSYGSCLIASTTELGVSNPSIAGISSRIMIAPIPHMKPDTAE